MREMKLQKTGDRIMYFTITNMSLMMTLALGLMLKSKMNSKKIECITKGLL